MIKRLIRKILGGKSAPHEPTILNRKEHGIDPERVSNHALRATETLQQAGFKAFIVGGAVRDLLLQATPKDFDVATDATPEQVKKLFRRAFIIGRRFRIVHVVFGQEIIEVTTFRGTTINDAPRDAHGRVLSDNTFGTQAEDAARRDFTVNAMYYDPCTQTVLDYHDGMRDLRAKRLRIIGEPRERYREDPVRMLRVVRFAAKLGFEIDTPSREPIAVMAPLINNVPAARIFDEMMKLLMSGHALACVKRLRHEGLHHGLLPLLDVVLEQPMGERFVTLALEATDARIQAGKRASPGFLFAALLWHQLLEKWKAYEAAGEHTLPALHLAGDEVLSSQSEKLALQHKLCSDMRDLWAMQPRFERRVGKSPYRLLENQRFRAGYDFLELRCQSGEIDAEIGRWWNDFADADTAGRENLIAGLKKSAGDAPKKRRRRPRKKTSESGTGQNAS